MYKKRGESEFVSSSVEGYQHQLVSIAPLPRSNPPVRCIFEPQTHQESSATPPLSFFLEVCVELCEFTK
jgi:hypothetical protein